MNKQLETNNFTLAIAIHNPGDELRTALKKVHSQKLDDSTIFFVYNSEFDGEYDDIADIGEEDLDANLTLGLYNDVDGMFYPSDVLTESLANQGGVGKDDISVDFLNSIDPNDYDDEINAEVKRIKDTYYVSDSMKDETIAKKKAESQQATNDSDDAKSAESQTNDGSQQSTQAQEQSSNSNVLPNEPEQVADNSFNEEQPVQEENELPQDSSAQNAYDEAHVDPLLSMAAERFKNECTTEIPQFDQWTTEQIRPAIVQANINLGKEQDNAIFAIYDKLTAERDKFERNFEDTIKEETEKHDQTIKTINDNKAVKIHDLKSQNEKGYEKAKEDFVQSQRPVLENKFDSDHREEFNKTLAIKIADAENQTQEEIDQENINYDNWRAEQEDRYLSEHLEKVDITPEINEFEKKAEIEINHLKEASQNFIDQVGVVTQNIDEKRKQAVAKYQQAQQELQTYKDTFDARVAEETARQVNEQTHDLQEKLRKADAENDDQRKKLHDMTQQNAEESQAAVRKHNDELAARDDHWRKRIAEIEKNNDQKLQKERAQNESMLHEKDAKIKQLKAEKEKAENDSKTMTGLVQQLQRRSFGQEQSRYLDEPPVQQTRRKTVNEEPVEPRKSESEKKSKMSTGTKVALTVAGIAVAGSLGFSAYVIGESNAQNAQTTSQTQNQSPSVVSDTENTQPKQYQKGDTWTYNAPNHKKYTVTMDSPTKGHYKDDNGVTHTIVISNQN